MLAVYHGNLTPSPAVVPLDGKSTFFRASVCIQAIACYYRRSRSSLFLATDGPLIVLGTAFHPRHNKPLSPQGGMTTTGKLWYNPPSATLPVVCTRRRIVRCACSSGEGRTPNSTYRNSRAESRKGGAYSGAYDESERSAATSATGGRTFRV